MTSRQLGDHAVVLGTVAALDALAQRQTGPGGTQNLARRYVRAADRLTNRCEDWVLAACESNLHRSPERHEQRNLTAIGVPR